MLPMTTTALRNDVETRVLTPEAIRFLTRLSREFEPRRQELLARRRLRQKQIDAGELPDFLPETAAHPRKTNGRSRPSRTTSSTAAWRSPAPSTAR